MEYCSGSAFGQLRGHSPAELPGRLVDRAAQENSSARLARSLQADRLRPRPRCRSELETASRPAGFGSGITRGGSITNQNSRRCDGQGLRSPPRTAGRSPCRAPRESRRPWSPLSGSGLIIRRSRGGDESPGGGNGGMDAGARPPRVPAYRNQDPRQHWRPRQPRRAPADSPTHHRIVDGDHARDRIPAALPASARQAAQRQTRVDRDVTRR